MHASWRGRVPHSDRRRLADARTVAVVAAALALSLVAAACGGGTAAGRRAAPAANPCAASAGTTIPQPTAAQMRAAGLDKLPVASDGKRVDLVAPPFSNSTSVTNPYWPISQLHSVVLNGKVGGQVFRTETTLLPDTRIVEWSPGQCLRTLVSQYVAYLDGRIEEVALDLYAQADDGGGWYLGEDVFNYADGIIADTSGTWLAGKEGPAAMIMPGLPKVGDVNRPENIPGLVFEEVEVTSLAKPMPGPRGPVKALVARELHDDGTFSDKLFAPGYGEFLTVHGDEIEALALAVPTDTLQGPVPVGLTTLLTGAYAVFEAAGARRWEPAAATVARMSAAWSAHQKTGGLPPRLVPPAGGALGRLDRAVKARNPAEARGAALDVALATLDLQLQYRRPAEIDLARSGRWLRQILVDAPARDLAAVSGDAATLEWIRDRVARSLDPVVLTRIDTLLEQLRTNVGDEDPAAAAKTAAALLTVVEGARVG